MGGLQMNGAEIAAGSATRRVGARAMTDADRYVTKAEIRTAMLGRETDILDALAIPWRDGRLHIRCPCRDHYDEHPSWRWDQRKARSYCTCHPGGHSALQVIMHVEGIDLEAAKIRAAELLGRTDLIRDRRKKRGGRGNSHPEQRCIGAIPTGCTLAAYAAAKQLPGELLVSLGIR
jgi:hypothetical protein